MPHQSGHSLRRTHLPRTQGQVTPLAEDSLQLSCFGRMSCAKLDAPRAATCPRCCLQGMAPDFPEALSLKESASIIQCPAEVLHHPGARAPFTHKNMQRAQQSGVSSHRLGRGLLQAAMGPVHMQRLTVSWAPALALPLSHLPLGSNCASLRFRRRTAHKRARSPLLSARHLPGMALSTLLALSCQQPVR